MTKIKWRQPAVHNYIKFLEKMDKKLMMQMLEVNPTYKSNINDLEEGIVLKELCKVALREETE